MSTHELEMNGKDTVRVFVSGVCDGLPDLREALAKHPEIELVGWSDNVLEGAATLSEEVREPRRTVPRAIFLSVLGVGVLYSFCVWAEVVGLGIAGTNATEPTATPWKVLAELIAQGTASIPPHAASA